MPLPRFYAARRFHRARRRRLRVAQRRALRDFAVLADFAELVDPLPSREPWWAAEVRRLVGVAALLLVLFALAPAVGSARFAWGGVTLQGGDVLLQARACYGEAQAHLEACTAMAHVHRKRALLRGVSFATAVRYSRAVRNPPRHRRWVLLLHPGLRAPAGWPSGQNWSYAQPRFRAVYEHVERFFRAPVADPCPRALHYGGPMDAIPSGFELDESCVFEGTRQRFFRRATSREADPS